MEKTHKIDVVSIRLVEEPPLYSSKELKNPCDVAELFQDFLKDCDREMFCILNLRTKNQVINVNVVGMGTLNSVLVHPREVFKSAILSNASSIILAHNHPSGDPEPSRHDIEVTKRLAEAGNLMGIEVLDPKPQRIVAIVDATQKITPNKNSTSTLASTICVLVTGIVRKFLNVSLSRSIKNSIAAMIPMIQGSRNCMPYPSTILKSPSNASALSVYRSIIDGVVIR